MPRLRGGLWAAVLVAPIASADYSDDAIRIGLLTDLSAVYSDIAGSGAITAAEMAIEDAGGEIDGVPIELLVADHQSDGDIAEEKAQRMIEDDGVDVFAELVSSSTALPVQALAHDAEIITLVSGAASTELTGEACSPTGFHWAYDTHALAAGTARAMAEEAEESWFFVTADYAFGHDLEANTTAFVEDAGGEVLGSALHPFQGDDFTAQLTEAEESEAEVIALANAGGDTVTTVRQAYEMGLLDEDDQRLAGLLLFMSELQDLGLYVAGGLQLTTGFYWDEDEQTREWSQRFRKRHGLPPTMVQASVYSSLSHYFEAVEEAGTDHGPAVADTLRGTDVDDFFARNGVVREDGRLVHDMTLMEVKRPSESEGHWDYLRPIRTISGDMAYRPLEEGNCPYVDDH